MNMTIRSSLALGLAALLAACSSTPPAAPVAATPAPAAAVAPAQTPTPPPATASAVAHVAVPAHLDPSSAIFKERSVYFDFDDYQVKPAYTRVLEVQGKYLASNPKLAIRVEGNADERGGTEYNLALGQKRAENVVKALKLIGVNGAQLEAVSWGKEKPKALGHDEAAWAENRRVDLVYPGK